MYLEVSGRQSGKTTRLVNHAIKYAEKGEHVVIVCMNEIHKKNLISVLSEISTKEIKFCRINIATYHDYVLDQMMYDRHKIYFDEFDSMNDEIPIIKNGYYVTTPLKLRTQKDIHNFYYKNYKDILLKLWVTNDYYCEKHTMDIERMKYLSYNEQYSNDLYYRQCLGNFCEDPCGPENYDPYDSIQEEIDWIVKTIPKEKNKNHDCECDMNTLIMNGCQCGAMPKKSN